MIEVITVREWSCRLCGAVERLRPEQEAPEKCPRCFDGEPVIFRSEGKDRSWTA